LYPVGLSIHEATFSASKVLYILSFELYFILKRP